MYLRIRRISPDKVERGSWVVAVAKQLEGKAIAMQPGQMEWWDGLQWNVVEIVSEDAGDESPWRHS